MNTSGKTLPRRAGWWGGLMIATAAAILGAKLSGAINAPTAYLLAVIPLALGAQYFRALQHPQPDCGMTSPALRRYNRGIALTSLGYALGMGIAMVLWNGYRLSDPAIFAISLLPALPTFAMIAVMGRYLAQEEDEYLRYRSVMASLWGLGLVLALGTFWGFMEMFSLVPHVWSWWVMPVWAIGMGIGQAILGWQADR